jgi:N-acetylglucosaminyldiphosphoundecaprenol N-acetyl-beta-D-mannosaminyltransferase
MMILREMKQVVYLDGVKLTPFVIADIVQKISGWLGKLQSPRRLTFMNAYVYCIARRNPELNSFISNSDVVVADGISIVLASCLLTRKRVSRAIMTHVFDDFLVSPDVPSCRGILVGTTESEVHKAMHAMNALSDKVRIVEAISGYHSDDYYSDVFSTYKDIDLVLVGMSTPKSEFLCREAEVICTKSIIWHIGGGTIKCYAGSKKRPPAWVHTLGVEWIHRFIFEKHTRYRYLVDGPVFFFYMAVGFLKSILGTKAGKSSPQPE